MPSTTMTRTPDVVARIAWTAPRPMIPAPMMTTVSPVFGAASPTPCSEVANGSKVAASSKPT